MGSAHEVERVVPAEKAPPSRGALVAACDLLATMLERIGARRPYLHLEGYMERFWLLRTPWLSARVHRILRSDHDRALHDHPWDYASIILRGGYWEITDGGRRWYGPGSIVVRRAEHLHRLVLPHGPPATTLFLHRRKRRDWGFRTEAGWVDWRTYAGARGEELV
jgi:hypothetical protein